MLTYEIFVSVLLNSIERTALNVAYTQELLDPHALGRSFSITLLPDGVEDDHGPQEPPLRATISFRWSPEFTVFSLRGGDTLDEIERFVDERLNQAHVVDVTYTIPLTTDQQRDIVLIPTLANRIQELHRALTHAENIVGVDVHLSFVSGRPSRIQSVTAHQTWNLDEALYDVELLSDTFDELCTELRTFLEELSKHFDRTTDDEPGPNGGGEQMSNDRRYFKPPTA